MLKEQSLDDMIYRVGSISSCIESLSICLTSMLVHVADARSSNRLVGFRGGSQFDFRSLGRGGAMAATAT